MFHAERRVLRARGAPCFTRSGVFHAPTVKRRVSGADPRPAVIPAAGLPNKQSVRKSRRKTPHLFLPQASRTVSTIADSAGLQCHTEAGGSSVGTGGSKDDPGTDTGSGRRRIHRQPPLRIAAPAGRGRTLSGQPVLGKPAQHPPAHGAPLLRVHPPRRDPADPAGGGPDLQPGLAGGAGALPVQPGQDGEDQRHGHPQPSGPGQEGRGPDPPGQYFGGLRRPPGPSPAGGLLGQRESHRTREAATTRESGSPKP